jgi:hypothetical protein
MSSAAFFGPVRALQLLSVTMKSSLQQAQHRSGAAGCSNAGVGDTMGRTWCMGHALIGGGAPPEEGCGNEGPSSGVGFAGGGCQKSQHGSPVAPNLVQRLLKLWDVLLRQPRGPAPYTTAHIMCMCRRAVLWHFIGDMTPNEAILPSICAAGHLAHHMRLLLFSQAASGFPMLPVASDSL